MVATQEQEPESGLQEDFDAAVVAFQGKYKQPSNTHARNKPLVQDRVYRVCHDPPTVVARRKEDFVFLPKLFSVFPLDHFWPLGTQELPLVAPLAPYAPNEHHGAVWSNLPDAFHWACVDCDWLRLGLRLRLSQAPERLVAGLLCLLEVLCCLFKVVWESWNVRPFVNRRMVE
ncbi:hypothetical protein FA13DRAFT_1724654 [Coprinellus micaceus]|uniref:Uncharacterized protein n=1 Tax=Coprinellus micaceus TaxID=71717 RepID=A0A4Y7TX25_COPMI|nr:hypothetical protein FA13DRAFT_1724654 [Coprinellus micaceus]